MTGHLSRLGGGGATGAVELEATFVRSSVWDPLDVLSHPDHKNAQSTHPATMKWNRLCFTTSH